MRFILIFFSFLLFLEFFLRFQEEIFLITQYKKIHCRTEIDLFLCPNIQKQFKRFDNSYWKISTNSFGERITSDTQDSREFLEEIWFIGDSISFGYLVDDEFSVPYLLNTKQQIPVRNLGVDSLGTNGIYRRLHLSLQVHKKTKIQTLIWIYNTSDFYDDEKEKLFDQFFYRNAYKVHHFLGSNFNLYNSLFWLKRKIIYQNELKVPEIHTEVSDDHITFTNISYLVEYIKKNPRIKNFVIVIYPGMDLKTKRPDIKSKVTQKIFDFFKKHQITIVDVRDAFFLSQQSPYFEFDGHPNEVGYQLILLSLIDFLKQK